MASTDPKTATLEQWEELVGEVSREKKLSYKVRYIFPKNWDAYSGDANLIKGYGKNILIDTFIAQYKNDFYQMLEDFDATHIDYLILTHYHVDHVGNVINMINDGYIDSSSYVYIPPDCQQIIDDQTLSDRKTEIITALNAANIPYSIPEENSKLELSDSFSIEFYNTDSNAISAFTNYNNCSTLCKIRHYDKVCFYTGDALGAALDRALNNGFIDGHVDLYKVEHHGIEYGGNELAAITKILPTFAYTPSFILDFQINNYSISTSLAYLQENGCKIYASFANTDYIIFESTDESLDVVQGAQSSSISNNNRQGSSIMTLFVDASTTNKIQSGTSEYPFKDLPQAIGYIEKKHAGEYTIRLKSGTYCTQHTAQAKNNPRANAVAVTIRADDGVSANSVIISGSCAFWNSNVNIKDVTFQNVDGFSSTSNLSFTYSTAELENVYFIGTSDPDLAIWSTKSNLIVHGCTFSNYSIAVSMHNDVLSFYGNTVDSCNYGIYNRGGLSSRNGNTYTNLNYEPAEVYSGGVDGSPDILYDGSATSGDITLDYSIKGYNFITVITGTMSGKTIYSDDTFAFYPSHFADGETYNIKTVDGSYTLLVSNDGMSLTITASNTSEPIRKILARRIFSS